MANATLYVGNLPYSVTETQLSAHFRNFGAMSARIVEGRGFGFVDIDSAQLEPAIAATHNVEMDGRTLTVSEAKPRESRSPSGSYGGDSRRQSW